MSLSAGSSPLHSPKITPHTSPAPRRRSHTPNPANYMVPTSASASVANAVSQPPSTGQVIQKETVGGTTYFYTDTTPAPLTGMVCWLSIHSYLEFYSAELVDTTDTIFNTIKRLFCMKIRPFSYFNCSPRITEIERPEKFLSYFFFMYDCVELSGALTQREQESILRVSMDPYIMRKHQEARFFFYRLNSSYIYSDGEKAATKALK